MSAEHILKLFQQPETVTSILAKAPTEAPGEVFKRLYGQGARRNSHPNGEPPSLETALACGNWGPTDPSPLFLRAFADAMACLDTDPLVNVVSPPLMASHGTVPLTVIAPLADIVRHCSNMIARAEREVILITSAWSPSVAQKLIKNALIELSHRAGQRGQKVVVKIMYDKASVFNAMDAHQVIKPTGYTGKGVQLPSPEEVPHLDMEVISMHKFVLGTLHAKFCVVDRKAALIMSNNMQDNDNMEMMTHVEGPIVDSIYDTALITWHKALNPPLPSRDSPAAQGGLPTASHEPLYLDREANKAQQEIAAEGHAKAGLPEHTHTDPYYDPDIASETTRMQSAYSPKKDETRLQAANRLLNIAVKKPIPPTGPGILDGHEMTPYISTATAHPVPMALVSRAPYGAPDSKNVHVPQNEAFLSLIRNAQRTIFIQTPDLNAAPLVPALAAALKRGVEVTYYICFGYNDAGEIIPGQGGTNDQAAQALISKLTAVEREHLHIFNYVGKDQNRPIHNTFKSRSCHIKLLIADGIVGIQGSGNQDTQSWYHSQEINIMIDSAEICDKWREGIDRNQNTRQFGATAEDGIWRDQDGKPGEGYMGNPGAVEGLIKGVSGFAQKLLKDW